MEYIVAYYFCATSRNTEIQKFKMVESQTRITCVLFCTKDRNKTRKCTFKQHRKSFFSNVLNLKLHIYYIFLDFFSQLVDQTGTALFNLVHISSSTSGDYAIVSEASKAVR
jgi:hypothetical protein